MGFDFVVSRARRARPGAPAHCNGHARAIDSNSRPQFRFSPRQWVSHSTSRSWIKERYVPKVSAALDTQRVICGAAVQHSCDFRGLHSHTIWKAAFSSGTQLFFASAVGHHRGSGLRVAWRNCATNVQGRFGRDAHSLLARFGAGCFSMPPARTTVRSASSLVAIPLAG